MVGKDRGRCIKQLEGLNNLRGELEIYDLENVTGGMEEAKEANMRQRHEIRELTFKWGKHSGIMGDDDNVFEGLQPHPNLKRFSIRHFGGAKYPTWMAASGLSVYKNLIEFKLEGCHRLEYVPTMLGDLPFLRHLILDGMEKVKCIGQEFYYYSNNNNKSSSTTGSSATSSSSSRTMLVAFPSLKELDLRKMPSLVEWFEVMLPNSSFPSLEKLSLWSCPKLKFTPSQFPSLKSLFFYNTNEMALKSLSSNLLVSLKYIFISRSRDLKSVPERLLQNNANVVESMRFSYCPELETIFPSCHQQGEGEDQGSHNLTLLVFPSLRYLTITNCPLVKPFSKELRGMTSLRELKLIGFKELKSLPEGLQSLTMLEKLEIGEFAEEGLEDHIKGEEDLQHLVSLRYLRLVGWPQHKNPLQQHQLEHLSTNLQFWRD